MAKQKPRKWKPKTDARVCVECEKDFKRGDLVYQDCAVNIHSGCLKSYWMTLRKLGLLTAK